MAPVAGTNLQDLADRLIDGGLEAWLRACRKRELSLGSIARELDREHDIAVTPTTVGNWCQSYGISTKRRNRSEAA